MSSFLRRVTLVPVAAAAALLVVSTSSVSLAQPAPPPSPPAAGSPIAEALFQQGRALLADGKTAEACDRFAQSQRIEPKLGTLLNLAACHEAQGLVATAWAEFTSAATLARRDGQEEREAFAREHIEALAKRLSTVRVIVASAPAGATIALDGSAVPLADAPLPVDPGTHRVEVTAPGHAPWSTTFTIDREASVREIHVPALAPIEASPPAPPPGATPGSTPVADGATEEDGGIPPLAIIGFSVGGAGLLVGSITGLVAIGQTSDIEDRCTAGACPPSEQDDIDAADTMANVSNVGFALGLVGIGVGVVALVIDDDDRPPASPARSTIEPVIGLGALGARGRF